ncbi:hypothetical protein EVAR_37636_1 [Eumeta japonica]|uniref:Uncharacterized protein n=1 Tax=Eumeta variegata TaxID=151549 RepID=A0A4C1VQZ5_EUMVA|nr:hypothetical protein EVAR_37636_1 [Eumeta japonica]
MGGTRCGPPVPPLAASLNGCMVVDDGSQKRFEANGSSWPDMMVSPTIGDALIGHGLDSRIGTGVPQPRGDSSSIDVVGPVPYRVEGDDPALSTVALY